MLGSENFISKKIDALVEKKIAERYIEKEAAFRQTEAKLTARLAKSREYRIMLRDYQQELREREESLDKREAELDQREKSMVEYAAHAALEKEQHAECAIIKLKEYEKALRETEFTVLDWVKRREAEDIDIFNEIMTDANKLQKFQESGKARMDGFQFEDYISNLLLRNGFDDVHVTQKTQDYGADITAKKDSIFYVFQCKYYSSPVGIEAVQQIYSSKIHYKAHVAVVVTNNVFTKAAKVLAKETNVLLWDCEKVAELEHE